ncbi:hypothetical protein [Pedobacter caeni]|uniref:Uncharacterized protein n=1 Tax=Pedobacter caeni TaxID=288992 RepID=A0A1M4Z2V9_9SPHI|nr:hypothetical protein [Pedobacter caeni]SHF12288.1 hypothetical protein SAMN04488522_102163 [Pedobacter caeni]
MKRILLLLIATATLGLASCKKDNVIQENVPNKTIIFTIQPGDWKATTDKSAFFAEYSIPAIDQLNVDEEGILVYFDHPVKNTSFIQLPYTFEGASYSYEHFDGGLSFDLQRANFVNEDPKQPTVPIKVKVILIPSMR